MPKVPKCEVRTHLACTGLCVEQVICSNRKGSQVFWICLGCRVYLGRQGLRFKVAKDVVKLPEKKCPRCKKMFTPELRRSIYCGRVCGNSTKKEIPRYAKKRTSSGGDHQYAVDFRKRTSSGR